ncbi:MAG TPA: EamA family transporter [Candidatus Aquilonibacter sp.]|nr:EamA family transporter [Candidatus Aquilonibacter sp.]
MTQAILYILIVFVGTGGELFVSRAMKTIGEVTDFRPHSIARVVARALALPRMWMGIALMAIAFFALLGMLSLAKVSFVFPSTALSYAAGALGGRLFLGERVSPQRWFGVLLVCLGVVLVFLGNG